MINQMQKKLTIGFDRDYVAVFSNIGASSPTEFYLLLTAHKSLEGGFGHPITEERCDSLLKSVNPEYKYAPATTE